MFSLTYRRRIRECGYKIPESNVNPISRYVEINTTEGDVV